MAYEIGTAAGYTDLLERLKDFLSDPDRVIGDHPDMTELVAIDDDVDSGESSQAWTVEEWNDDRDSGGDGDCELFITGPGTAGTDEIYTWIDTESSEAYDYYNWRLAGMTGYSALLEIANQPGVTPGRLPRMLMWKNPIPYWFLGNGRRFVIIAQISNVYEMCYGGFCLPYGLPTQFPYPLVIGGGACPGTDTGDLRYSSTEVTHRGFANPYGSGAGIIPVTSFDATSYYSTLKFMQGTNWHYSRNRSGSTRYSSVCVWPFVSSYENYQIDGGDIVRQSLRENLDGSYPVFPLIICSDTPNKHILGELQGCYATTGYGGISAEDTFTINGDTYIIFPCVPNADRGDFMCIKKE